MKETIKIIRPKSLSAFLFLLAAAFVGCDTSKSAATIETASTPAANIARMPDAETSRLEPVERPLYEESENIRPATRENSSKVVTKANFDRIKIGISYRETVQIFGEEGVQTSTMRVHERETTIFKWTVPDFSRYIDLHFENGKVIEKKQKNLQ